MGICGEFSVFLMEKEFIQNTLFQVVLSETTLYFGNLTEVASRYGKCTISETWKLNVSSLITLERRSKSIRTNLLKSLK